MNVKLGGWVPDPKKETEYLGFEEELGSFLTAVSQDLSDLRPYTSQRHNQKQTGSCVGQSCIKALEVLRIKKYGRGAHVDLSVMALYYLARELMSPQRHNIDKGTHISLAADVLRKHGAVTDKAWPWRPDKINHNIPILAMRTARLHKINAHYRIKSRGNERVEQVIKALAAGHPVVFGTRTHAQWSGYDGKKPITPLGDREKRGGHATVLLGYDGRNFIGENSWGTRWGDNGFYTMETDVIKDDAHDLWVFVGGWEEYAR